MHCWKCCIANRSTMSSIRICRVNEMRIEFHQQNYYFVYVTAYDMSSFRWIFQQICVLSIEIYNFFWRKSIQNLFCVKNCEFSSFPFDALINSECFQIGNYFLWKNAHFSMWIECKSLEMNEWYDISVA